MAVPARMRTVTRALARMYRGRARYARAARVAFGVLASYRRLSRRRSSFGSDAAWRDAWQALHRANARRVTRLCQVNGATWVKLAQVMSCRPDVLPMAYIEELRQLQNDAPPVPFAALVPVLVAQYGADWHRQFAHVDPVPVATASIAQVHRGRTTDGRDVAIKIRLPEVVTLFRQDFAFFAMIANLAAPFIRQVDLQQIARQLLAMTSKELDFRTEADNLRQFAAFPHNPKIHCPRLVDELSGEQVLVTSWVQGVRLREYLDAHHGLARELLNLLLDSYIQQTLAFGVYHADPHPGNFIINDAGEITILDFGALGTLSRQDAVNYGALLLTLFRRSDQNLRQVFENAGFRGLDEQTIRETSKLFLGVKGSEQYTETLAQAMDTLQRHHVTMPDSFVSLARVLITVGGFMQTYQVKMNLDQALVQHVTNAVARNFMAPPVKPVQPA